MIKTIVLNTKIINLKFVCFKQRICLVFNVSTSVGTVPRIDTYHNHT